MSGGLLTSCCCDAVAGVCENCASPTTPTNIDVTFSGIEYVPCRPRTYTPPWTGCDGASIKIYGLPDVNKTYRLAAKSATFWPCWYDVSASDLTASYTTHADGYCTGQVVSWGYQTIGHYLVQAVILPSNRLRVELFIGNMPCYAQPAGMAAVFLASPAALPLSGSDCSAGWAAANNYYTDSNIHFWPTTWGINGSVTAVPV